MVPAGPRTYTRAQVCILKDLSWFSFQQLSIEYALDASLCARHVVEQGKVPAQKGLTI